MTADEFLKDVRIDSFDDLVEEGCTLEVYVSLGMICLRITDRLEGTETFRIDSEKVGPLLEALNAARSIVVG